MLSPQDYWRAIVLYGANVATYKIALAICLMRFAEQDKTQVTMNELAQAFFQAYRQRLANGLPQQSNPARKTLLERAVEGYQHGELSKLPRLSWWSEKASPMSSHASTPSIVTPFPCVFMRPPQLAWF